MDLLSSVDLLRTNGTLTPFSRWVDDLHFTCGSFSPSRMDANVDIRGAARRINAGGVEFSHISNDLDRIERDWQDVRRDAVEQIFLIIQLEGSCGVEHLGQQDRLEVGDCILIDSTRPTTFHFGGTYSNHISMNLSQQDLCAEGSDQLDVAQTLRAGDPMATVLRALMAKVLLTQDNDIYAPNLRALMLSAIRQAFASKARATTAFDFMSDTASRRLQMAQLLIEQNLTSPDLSAKWLANRVGVSPRVLQLHFQGLGMTCTTFIRDKRLELARRKLERLHVLDGAQTIADIAYSVGFNDLSYFNRCFKELFDCAPSELMRRGDRH